MFTPIIEFIKWIYTEVVSQPTFGDMIRTFALIFIITTYVGYLLYSLIYQIGLKLIVAYVKGKNMLNNENNGIENK